MIPLRDNLPTRHRIPYITIFLIVINSIIFALELSEFSTGNSTLINHYALSTTNFSFLHLLSFQFLHGGWVHIIGNMLYLWIFGNNVEDRLGHVQFLTFYLCSGVIGGLAQLLTTAGDALIIGASASVAGVLGAYLIWYPRAQVKVLLPLFIIFTVITLPASLILVLWFVTNLFNGYASIVGAAADQVAYLGHIGGFIFGVFVALIVSRVTDREFNQE